MSVSPVRSVQGALREMLASMSDRQLGRAAWESGIPRRTLIAFAEGRSGLAAESLQRLGEHMLRGAYLVKKREEETTC